MEVQVNGVGACVGLAGVFIFSQCWGFYLDTGEPPT